MENKSNMKDASNVKDKSNKEEGNKACNKELDRYERIVDRAHKEIESVHRTYRLVAWALTIIFSTGVVLAAIFVGKTLGDLEDRLNKKAELFEAQVKSRIDQEFKEENIQDLIVKEAKQHTKEEVQRYIAVEVNEAITPFKEEMQSIVQRADIQIKRFNDLFTVSYTADRAISGSKRAYIDLRTFAAKGRTEMAIIARSKLVEIERWLDIYRQVPSIYKSLSIKKDGSDIPLDKVSLSLIVNMMLKQSASDDIRLRCMPYIVDKPKEEVFKEALKVFESDSLSTCAAFCGILSKISDEKADFLDFDAWIKICQKQVSKK